MKQFILFLLGMLVSYFAWTYASRRDQRMLKKFGMRHVVAVVVILIACFTLLLTMFFNRAVSIL